MAISQKKQKQEYGDDSISSLKGADRVRTRPAVIFGSDGLEGCEHSFFEILSNSVDEAREGHGNVIQVTTFLDKSIEVDDRGRGVPLGWNESEGRWNWDLVFCELYAGGKYDNNSGAAAYEYSLGLNGLGATATQYSSEYMDVYSYNGTVERSIHFKKGEVCSELAERPLEKKEKRTGTVIRWKPDLAVFTDIDIPTEFYVETLRRQSVVNAGICFRLRVQQENKTFATRDFVYPNGIRDYLSERVGDAAFTAPVEWHLETKGRDREDLPEYKVKADITFCFSKTVQMLEYYHNSSYLEYGGAPDKAVKSAFTYAIDKYCKGQKLYKKDDDKIVFQNIQDSLILVINSFSTLTSYENQTKKAINNVFIANALNQFLRSQLEIYFVENPMAANLIANQALINMRSDKAANKAKTDLKTILDKASRNTDPASRVEKFVNCRSKDPARAELYIVEGDSALTSCKLGRDAEFQAIIPVRGKTLNCLKSDYSKISKNEIITDLLTVIGCGVEIEEKHRKKKDDEKSSFDLDKLRWSKVIICTDADEDGFQIRTLLLTLFYRLLPTLLKEHKVFIAESPLFEITVGDETLFAYDEFEKADILKELGNKKYKLQRSKGLGENEPAMMWQTTMNPETRRLISVSPADAEQTAVIFETLLGDDLPARKQFITEHGSQYMKDIDV